MKRHVWAQPNLKDWHGFKPTAYFLDTDKVWKLPLTDTSTGATTTFGEVVEAFRDQAVEVDEPVVDLTLTSKTRSMSVKGPSTTLQLLALLHELAAEQISIMQVAWFYYDHDSCMKDPHERYSFFMVANDKIVRESVSLSDYSRSGFDPGLLDTFSGGDRIWANEDEWQQARDRYWYRRFYSGTRLGQLMVLRPDRPELYYYPEGRYAAGAGVEGWLAQVYRGIKQLKVAIWVLIIITLLAWLSRYW